MSTASLINQFVQNWLRWPRWLERAHQRRVLRRAIARIYPSFARQYPEWPAYLFDEQFLYHLALSSLTSYLEYKAVPPPFELARLWAEQFTWSTLEMKERHVSQLMPVAHDFLRRLSKELFNYPERSPVSGKLGRFNSQKLMNFVQKLRPGRLMFQ